MASSEGQLGIDGKRQQEILDEVAAENKKNMAGHASLVLGDGAQAENDSCPTLVVRCICIGFSCLISIIPIFWLLYTKVFEQYERAVIFRLGKVLDEAKGPGMYYFLPMVDSYTKVDLRVRTIDVPSQDMMTKDSVTARVNAVVYFRVSDPRRAVLMVEDYVQATALLAQTTLRSVVGECELDELLGKREKINDRMKDILDTATDPWGVKVTTVEVKDVVLPDSMQRSMASQAEAERERRAKVISADGELQASRTLLQAAQEMTQNQATMQLRYLQTLTQISMEKNSTVVFPLPLELVALLKQKVDAGATEKSGTE